MNENILNTIGMNAARLNEARLDMAGLPQGKDSVQPPEDVALRNAILLDSDNVLMTEDGVPVVYN